MIKTTLAALALVVSVAPAFAAELPAICPANAGHAMHDTGSGGMGMDMGMGMGMGMGTPDQAHQDLMAGMDAMNRDMMAGGTASDIDVAFVCSMIPHHQGAIDMAKAELTHGDDPWAREMAQKVIDAQEAEIAAMLNWLSKQPQ
jgi:uncharacterized protein (DUF305 family)